MTRKKLDFGIRVPVSGPLASTQNIISSAKQGEALGFQTIWVHDQIVWDDEANSHHISSGSIEAVLKGKDPEFYESITTLSFLAGITDRVKLGVAVIVLPLRNPVILAKQLMNLDVFSNGRLVLGLGSGARFINKSFDTVGASFEKRGEITDDFAGALLAIFDHSRKKSSYTGNFSRFSDADIFPKSKQNPHPPIIFGGLGRASRRAALLGDGWIPANITASDISKGIKRIKVIATRAGRGDVDFLIGNEIFASIDKDSETARKKAAATIGSYAKSIGRGSEEVTLVGSVSEVRKKVENYVDAGVNMFELKFIYKDMQDFFSQLQLFAGEVIPSFN